MSNGISEWDSRLTRIERLVESNAKSIQALSNNMGQLSDEVRVTQRQLRDSLYRINDHAADIRELILENQRILRYLERGKE